MTTTSHDLFEDDLDLPDPLAQQRYARLIGLDHVKTRLAKEAELILQPHLLREWSLRTHNTVLPAVDRLTHRPPLIIFAGDVGTGKPPSRKLSPTPSPVGTESTCASSG